MGMKKEKPVQYTVADRAAACLWGAAAGDAMGKASEGYSPARILEVYGKRLRGFVEPVQPLSQFAWKKGEITEDTRQTLAVAEAILEKGGVDQLAVSRRLLACDPKGVGTSSRLFHFILSGDIGHVAAKGSGNGAATRAAPVGLVDTTRELNKLVEDVVKTTTMTHGGKVGVAGACAVAAAVSAAVEGWPAGYVMLQALQAAKLAEGYGNPDNLVPVAAQIQTAIDLAAEFTGSELWERVDSEIGWGFSANQAVPAALTAACTLLNAKEAILLAVNRGGDADAVAGIAGAVAAAINPLSLPRKWIETVKTVNGLDMDSLARQLVELRPETRPSARLQSQKSGGTG